MEINDKHIEIIIARMLRKVKIENPGDTSLLPGSVMDKFDFRMANDALSKCLKITSKGDSDFEIGAIVPKDTLEQVNSQIEALGGESAKGKRPRPSTASTQLLRHHKSGGAKQQLYLGGQLPGDNQGAHGSGTGRKSGSPGRLERKCDPGTPDPGGNRIPQVSRVRSADQPSGSRGTGGPQGNHAPFPVSRCSNRRPMLATEQRQPFGQRLPSRHCWAVRSPIPTEDRMAMMEMATMMCPLLLLRSREAAAGTGIASVAGGHPGDGFPTAKDDLTIVEGIGPKIAELLVLAGILSFDDLAATEPDAIRAILAEAGGIFRSINPSTWPEQAKLAAAGDWDRLRAWQDELQGGV